MQSVHRGRGSNTQSTKHVRSLRGLPEPFALFLLKKRRPWFIRPMHYLHRCPLGTCVQSLPPLCKGTVAMPAAQVTKLRLGFPWAAYVVHGIRGVPWNSKPVQLVPERTWVLPPQNTCFSLLCQRLWGLPHPWGFSKPCILSHLESLKSICVRHLLIGHLLYAGHCAGPVLLARKYILYLILTDNAKLLKATNSSSFNIFWNIAIKDNGYGWRTLNIYDKIWKDYILHS